MKKKCFTTEKNIDPIDAKIEAYGLGNMMSKIKDENNIIIPMDILNYLSKKSNIDADELIKSYVVGLIKEKNAKNESSFS